MVTIIEGPKRGMTAYLPGNREDIYHVAIKFSPIRTNVVCTDSPRTSQKKTRNRTNVRIMGFTYVIGKNMYLQVTSVFNIHIFVEHMEEDESTSRAIPKWVELEYSVGRSWSSFQKKAHR